MSSINGLKNITCLKFAVLGVLSWQMTMVKNDYLNFSAISSWQGRERERERDSSAINNNDIGEQHKVYYYYNKSNDFAKPVNCSDYKDPDPIIHEFTHEYELQQQQQENNENVGNKRAKISFAIDFSPWFPNPSNNKDDNFLNLLRNSFGDVVSTSSSSSSNNNNNELYVDVGANIGQTSIPSLALNIPTLAFDPLAYDIRKICGGLEATAQQREFVINNNNNGTDINSFHLFRALVGDTNQRAVNISRPDDKFGKFEQASLAANTIGVVRKPKLVTEEAPMITLDSIVPDNIPVGMVKIDVQGYELPVIKGMTKLLERKWGYPHVVYYEEDPRITKGAGFELGAVQKILESHQYNCTSHNNGHDITCKKPRATTKR